MLIHLSPFCFLYFQQFLNMDLDSTMDQTLSSDSNQPIQQSMNRQSHQDPQPQPDPTHFHQLLEQAYRQYGLPLYRFQAFASNELIFFFMNKHEQMKNVEGAEIMAMNRSGSAQNMQNTILLMKSHKVNQTGSSISLQLPIGQASSAAKNIPFSPIQERLEESEESLDVQNCSQELQHSHAISNVSEPKPKSEFMRTKFNKKSEQKNEYVKRIIVEPTDILQMSEKASTGPIVFEGESSRMTFNSLSSQKSSPDRIIKGEPVQKFNRNRMIPITSVAKPKPSKVEQVIEDAPSYTKIKYSMPITARQGEPKECLLSGRAVEIKEEVSQVDRNNDNEEFDQIEN